MCINIPYNTFQTAMKITNKSKETPVTLHEHEHNLAYTQCFPHETETENLKGFSGLEMPSLVEKRQSIGFG